MQKLVKTAAPASDPAVAALLPAFLARRAEDARLLEAAVASGDFATITGIGHRLKGLGSTYGFPAITDAGRALEGAGAERDAAQAHRALESFISSLAGIT